MVEVRDFPALERARERGWITLDEIMHLASGSPVDVEEAIDLTRAAGISLLDDDGDGWGELEKLADDGPEKYKEAKVAPKEVESTEAATLYLRDISKTPLLTAAEEVQLAKQIEAGVKAQARLSELAPDHAEARDLKSEVRRGKSAQDRLMRSN